MTVRPVAAPTALPAPAALPVIRRPRLRGWLMFTIAVIAAFFVLIYSRTELDRSAFTIDELDRRIAAEQDRYWDLRLDIARLETPARIARLAEDIGMVYPQEQRQIAVAGVPETTVEDRWVEIKTVLSTQP